jgi:hypothetical protein
VATKVYLTLLKKVFILLSPGGRKLNICLIQAYTSHSKWLVLLLFQGPQTAEQQRKASTVCGLLSVFLLGFHAPHNPDADPIHCCL